MTQIIAGQPAPELAVPYWIGVARKESSSHSQAAHGTAQASSLLLALLPWLSLARVSNFTGVGSRSPCQGPRGRRSRDGTRGRLRRFWRQTTARSAGLWLPVPSVVRPLVSLRRSDDNGEHLHRGYTLVFCQRA